jgi:AcrR family transcriptional regulator
MSDLYLNVVQINVCPNVNGVKIDARNELHVFSASMARTTQRRSPPSRPKEPYHHGDLRNALLEAALALVAETSVAELSLREVARRAGVTYAAPYHHFADKSALLAAVACQGFEGLAAELERAAARRTTLESEFLAMAEAYVAFAIAHPSHYRVMFLPEVKESVDAKALRVAGDRAFGMLLERVERARPDGTEREHRVLATTIWAALHGLSLLAIDGILQNKLPQPEKMMSEACRSIVGIVT